MDIISNGYLIKKIDLLKLNLKSIEVIRFIIK